MVYSQVASDRTSTYSSLKIVYIFSRHTSFNVLLEIGWKNRTLQCGVVKLLYLHCYCEQDASCAICLWCRVPQYLWNNLHFRSKHHKISPAWLRIFTLFKFICSYSVYYQTNYTEWRELRSWWTLQLPNEIRSEIHNFVSKFTIWLFDNCVMKLPSS